jgi:hypothetical protein
MVALLTPEELEKFAEIDRIEKESKATISGLLEKVKGRGLSGWRDKEIGCNHREPRIFGPA